ncbi:hypothetical protein CAPTEDRAFT_110004 [Capitella teleta]|uniref:AB hydrolase-1 domain-containing protein n=1 Tax=Capitella teleta TaxID=283909 RepID=R7UMG5_CAPTE|nr:hypothetical protein CAPTEDRAFT_110004 [Capitella teleta]|eukprot:ELU04432.1 hypothetical protein CAPTEDRAFT_110004 [Capitella teleta]
MYQKRRVHVLDSYISYIDTRAGEETVIFLHGNLSYSYTWRNIIPRVDGYARCLAPDLLGHGDSAKDPSEAYSFLTHYNYLDAWIESTRLPQKLIIVGHDWGVALGALWASRNPSRVKAFVHLEGVVGVFSSWNGVNLSPGLSELYHRIRDPDDDEGRTLATTKNILMDTLMTKMTLERVIGSYELSGIQRPYTKPGEARKAAVAWIRQLPVQGEGQNGVAEIMKDIHGFMEDSDEIPKLYIHANPGQYSTHVSEATQGWSQQQRIEVEGGHFPHEDDPEAVGEAIGTFVQSFARMGFRRP